MQRNYYYIRVSTKEQNIDRQLDAIKDIDIDERDIYIDKSSGKNFERESYKALKRSIRAGDTLYVKSLDRFGRNKQMILEEWDWLIKNDINIVVLDIPMLDTRKYIELDGVQDLVTTLVLQILSWLAETERNQIRSRQKEGIDSAKSRGVIFGRPKIKIDDKFIPIYNKWKSGEVTAVTAMELCGMKSNTFYRRVRELDEKLNISLTQIK